MGGSLSGVATSEGASSQLTSQLYAGDGWYLPANLDGVAFFFCN